MSQSVYVALPLNAGRRHRDERNVENVFKEPLKLAVWTTTPWTMPANAAVAMNPKNTEVHFKGEKIIVVDGEFIGNVGNKLTPLGDAHS